MASQTKISAATIGAQKKTDLPEAVFAEPFNETLVHETARAELNARRAGTHAAYRHRFSVLDMRPLRATKDDDEHGANEHYASAVRVWRAVRAVACD